jgi:hypothetical protein
MDGRTRKDSMKNVAVVVALTLLACCLVAVGARMF